MTGPGGTSGRVRTAFSLRRNLRAMLVPPEGHLRPVDGLRALSILWVTLFHSAWYSLGHVFPDRYVAMLRARWMLPVWRGDFGVDVFFVLSGFLIAGMLADERARSGRIRLGLFYVRRWMRLWPPLAVAAAIDVALFHDHSDMIWANLFYVSNFVPFIHLAMGWTWSLSIEEQFYLLCPWLVFALARCGKAERMVMLGLIAIGLCVVSGAVFVHGQYRAEDVEIAVYGDLGRWVRSFDDLYVKPWMRAGPLLAGVAAAYVYRVPAAMQALARRRIGASAGLVLALCVAPAATHWPLVEHAARPVEVLYVAVYRTMFGGAIAYVMLFSLSEHPLGRALGRVLSSRALYPFAQLAYSAYLLNPIIATLVHFVLAPAVAISGVPPMVVFYPADFVVTFAAAAGLYLAVERPSLELRPTGRPLAAAAAVA